MTRRPLKKMFRTGVFTRVRATLGGVPCETKYDTFKMLLEYLRGDEYF